MDIEKCRDLFEIIESRDCRKATIIISQIPVSRWYQLFGDSTYADACLSRMTSLPYDLLQNYTAITMLANSEFVTLLKQANTDSSKMAEDIGVSEAQLRFVTHTAPEMGLIKCGSVVITFDNQISKDILFYDSVFVPNFCGGNFIEFHRKCVWMDFDVDFLRKRTIWRLLLLENGAIEDFKPIRC